MVYFQSEPFLRTTEGGYEGFIVDLVEEMSALGNFTYSLLESRDDRYGVEQRAGGDWTGLVGMLLRREIDVIAADLTITASRLAVMDFSKPFMSSSITLLLKVMLFISILVTFPLNPLINCCEITLISCKRLDRRDSNIYIDLVETGDTLLY